MSEWHCAGCHGHLPDSPVPCPGLTFPDDGSTGFPGAVAGIRIRFHHHLTALPWPARIKILLGLRVCTDIEVSTGLGKLADVTDLVTDGIGPDDLTGPGGPWNDQT